MGQQNATVYVICAVTNSYIVASIDGSGRNVMYILSQLQCFIYHQIIAYHMEEEIAAFVTVTYKSSTNGALY